MTILGAAIILGIVLLAILAPFITKYDPTKINIVDRFKAPSMTHFFGTDEVGRDIFTRVLYGTRISLSAAVIIILIAGILKEFLIM